MSMSITIMIMAGTNTSTAMSTTMRATPMSTKIITTPTTITTVLWRMSPPSSMARS